MLPTVALSNTIFFFPWVIVLLLFSFVSSPRRGKMEWGELLSQYSLRHVWLLLPISLDEQRFSKQVLWPFEAEG